MLGRLRYLVSKIIRCVSGWITKMAAQGLDPADVTTAIANQSLEAAPGKLGKESDASLEYVIRYKGKRISLNNMKILL